MTAQTYSARQTAREVSKRLGKDVSDKRVRDWVRQNVEAYDDDGYTTHAYDRRTFDRIVKGMTGAARKPRAQSASNGRKGTRKASTPRTPKVAAPTTETAPDA